MKKLFTILGLSSVAILSAQNLLTNPSFESDLEGWSAGTGDGYTLPEVISENSQNGDKHVTYNPITATTGFYQKIAVTEGEVYEINFWYKASGDETDARLWSIFKNSEGANVYTTESADEDPFRTNNGYLLSAAEWTFHTAKMPAGAGAVSLDVAFRGYTGGNVSFDNIQAGKEGTMSVSDVNNFANGVKMNTIVTDKLFLTLTERATVNIYSLDGKLISSNRINNGESINLQSLPKGTYLVTVSNGYNKISQKVIKK